MPGFLGTKIKVKIRAYEVKIRAYKLKISAYDVKALARNSRHRYLPREVKPCAHWAEGCDPTFQLKKKTCPLSNTCQLSKTFSW